MIKKLKVIICDICLHTEVLKKGCDEAGEYEIIPLGWTRGIHSKTHLCPTCSQAFYKLKYEQEHPDEEV